MKFSAQGQWLLCFCAFILIASCSREQISTDDWEIPRDEIRDGGPGKDGIPSVDNPQFSTVAATTYLQEEDLVIGVAMGDVVRVYPHPILDWHEIVNDEINGTSFALTYCPLTGSGVAWDRVLQGEVTTFGVSGLLFESNLIPYDRKTDSNWSQMQLACVNGPLAGTEIPIFPLIETTWKTWKEMYPDAEVMTTETGFDRSYGEYPYGDYRTNNDFLLFPVSNPDTRLPEKERVHGIIVGDQAKVYRFDAFAGSTDEETVVIQDEVQGQQVVLVGNSSDNWIVSFLQPAAENTFTAVQDGGAVIMEDELGNRYDVFGRIVDGPGVGGQLTMTRSYLGYWFAWGTFFPGAEIF